MNMCPRCEYRVRYLERGTAMRVECQDGYADGCYGYTPVMPVVLKRDKRDCRPFSPMMFGARLLPVRYATHDDLQLTLTQTKDGYLKTWIPISKKRGKK